jgi:hypothetical protein
MRIPGVVLALATALVASVCRRGGIPIGARLRGLDWADAELFEDCLRRCSGIRRGAFLHII